MLCYASALASYLQYVWKANKQSCAWCLACLLKIIAGSAALKIIVNIKLNVRNATDLRDS